MAKKLNGFSEDNTANNINETGLIDVTEGPAPSEKNKKKLQDFLNNFRIHRSPGKKEPFKANPKILFGILAGICVVLIILSALFEQVARPFRTVASYLVVPAQSGINIVGTWLSDRLEVLDTMENLVSENEELKKTNDQLRAENNELRQKNSEADLMRDLLDLKDEYSSYETVAVKIISKDASKWFSTFTVNKGSNDGIMKNMNVVAQGGLVGVVTDVGLNYSTVRTVINDESNISATFEYSTDLCVISGNLTSMDDNLIDFSNASINVDISVGDAVVTSNVSSIYLPGLLIGYVNDFQTDGNELTQSGHITPVVDFDNLSEVLIITQLKETFGQ